MGADLPLRIRAARHEVRCSECRVTWKSWLQRILNIKAGFTPGARTDGQVSEP